MTTTMTTKIEAVRSAGLEMADAAECLANAAATARTVNSKQAWDTWLACKARKEAAVKSFAAAIAACEVKS